MGDLFPPGVLGVIGEVVLAEFGRVEMAPRRRVQRLDRVVADADVEEVLLDELPDAGDVRVVGLLVEHRAAVAREAAGPALGFGRGEEQLRAAPLTGVSAPFSPARKRSNGVFRVTTVRRKVACARNSVWSFTRSVMSFLASA